MALRFTDTNKWRDPWYMELPVLYKALWQYVCDNCDNAGVWAVNQKLAEFEIREPIEWTLAVNLFEGRVDVLDSGRKWYLTKFLSFQYPGGLGESHPHKQVLRLLASHGIAAPIRSVSPSPLIMEGGGGGRCGASEGYLVASKTRPDQTTSLSSGGVQRGGEPLAGPDPSLLLAEFGLPNSGKALAEWKGGINTIARCRSVEEARAFLRWVIRTGRSQGVEIEYFRQARTLAAEWNTGQRHKHWQAGA